MRREVQAIYYLASLHTRQWYDRAVCQEGVNWDNWIIRWCLWHAFRYRDSRNTNSDAPDGRRTRGSPSEVGNSQRSMPQEQPVVLYRVSGEFCFPTKIANPLSYENESFEWATNYDRNSWRRILGSCQKPMKLGR